MVNMAKANKTGSEPKYFLLSEKALTAQGIKAFGIHTFASPKAARHRRWDVFNILPMITKDEDFVPVDEYSLFELVDTFKVFRFWGGLAGVHTVYVCKLLECQTPKPRYVSLVSTYFQEYHAHRG